MMRSHYFLTVCISFLISGSVHSLDTVLLPPEGVKVMLPSELSSSYTHDFSYFTEDRTHSSLVSSDKAVSDGIGLIGIEFIKQANLYPTSSKYIEEFITKLRFKTIASSCVLKYTWNIIEQSNSDVIYEYLIHGDSPNSTISHDISRIIFTEHGVHMIYCASDRGQLSDKERELWIKSLKNSTSVVKHANGEKKKRETLAEKLQESINLGEAFSNWKVIGEEILPKSCEAITRLIPKNEINPRDVLDVTTFADIQDSSIYELFQKETTNFSELMQQKIDFKILKQSKNEVIYIHSYESGGKICNAVTRAIIKGQVYHHVLYTRALSEKCDSNEIEAIKALLEKIQF